MDISALPFNNALGILTDGDNVRLAPNDDHLNHLDTVHATVLYGVAESACGMTLLKRFPDLLDSHIAVLRSSSVKYRRPAVLGSDILGLAKEDEGDFAAFMSALTERGRATIEIGVAVSQDDIELLSGTFCWFATRSSKVV